MNIKESSILSHILKYGLMLGIIWFIYKLTNNLLSVDYNNNKILFVIEIIIHFGATTFFIYKYKIKNNNFLSLKQAVIIGLGIVSIGSFIPVSHDYIYDNFVEYDLIVEKIEAKKENISTKNPDLSDEEIAQKIQKLKDNRFDKSQYIIEFIWNLSLGLIISLLGGALMQKNKDIYE